MKNYFQMSKDNPYHISIGAVVVNDKNEICCHHFDKIEVGGTLFEDIHILMRETIEPNESIEQCLERGLKEEFGMKAELVSYLGSITSILDLKDLARVEKTTLYFLCKPIDFDYEKRKRDDSESSSNIKWIKADELIQLMKKQADKYKRDDADESKIIMRIKF
jgi:ADP-ribose pyrophosphatase YjhB (NUDIX family)